MHKTTIVIGQEAALERLDKTLIEQFPDRSRNYFQHLISDACVTINGRPASKASHQVRPGDTIEVCFPAVRIKGALPLPDVDLGVTLEYEHDDFLIIFKPAGLLVHAPHKLSSQVTLVDWLIHRFKDLKSVGYEDRPGIVHRLDKDTSGLMIIPRTMQSHAYFSSLFEKRQIKKTYRAFVEGHPAAEGFMDFSINRDPKQLHKMTFRYGGRDAYTSYRVVERYENSSLLELYPLTGRTHQIRVHCLGIGAPLLGDTTYGTAHEGIQRQALHAYKLSFTYKEQAYTFLYEMPADMLHLQSFLKSTPTTSE